MRALDLAMLEVEVQQSDLSPAARKYLVSVLKRDCEKRLRLGRVHLKICRHIESCQRTGLSPYSYGIQTAASLFDYDESTVGRIWRRYGKFYPESRSISQLKRAS